MYFKLRDCSSCSFSLSRMRFTSCWRCSWKIVFTVYVNQLYILKKLTTFSSFCLKLWTESIVSFTFLFISSFSFFSACSLCRNVWIYNLFLKVSSPVTTYTFNIPYLVRIIQIHIVLHIASLDRIRIALHSLAALPIRQQHEAFSALAVIRSEGVEAMLVTRFMFRTLIAVWFAGAASKARRALADVRLDTFATVSAGRSTNCWRIKFELHLLDTQRQT